jgi:hypothetical protein
MREREHTHLLLNVDDPHLKDKLVGVMRTLIREEDAIRQRIGTTVVRNLQTMARMGVYFEEHVQQRYPEFPLRNGIRAWGDYLPPLSPSLGKLIENYS